MAYLAKYLIAGLIVGTVFLAIPDGNYKQRVSVMATSYFCVSVVMVDLFKGIHERKHGCSRESISGASSFVAYWIADPVPAQLVHFLGCNLFILPVYLLAGLRSGIGSYLYFYILLMLAIAANLSLAYIVALFSKTEAIARMIFNGVLIPLQLLLSGYLVLLSTMPVWLQWGCYINPMSYFMAGVMGNEFKDNEAALGLASYEDIMGSYGYKSTMAECFLALLTIAVLYRLLWLAALKVVEISKKKEVLRKVGAAKKKMTSAVFAGLNLDKPFKSTSMSLEEEALAELDYGSALHQQKLEAKAAREAAGSGGAGGVASAGNSRLSFMTMRFGSSSRTTSDYIAADDSIML